MTMIYYYVMNGNPYPTNKVTNHSMEVETDQEALDARCIANITLDNDVVRFKTEEEKEQVELDKMTVLNKIEVLEALDSLPTERAKFNMIMGNDRFAERWQATTNLDLNHADTVGALALVGLDVSAVKRQILTNKRA